MKKIRYGALGFGCGPLGVVCVFLLLGQVSIFAGDVLERDEHLTIKPMSESQLVPLMFPGRLARSAMERLQPREKLSQHDVFALIDSQVEAEMAVYEAPGAAIAIVIDHALAYSQGYGVKHRNRTDGVNATSQFRVGSVSKMFTAAAVMREAELGNVDLAQPVTDFIPELTFLGSFDVDKITVHHLLTHATGIPDGFEMHCATDENSLADWAGSLFMTRLFAPAGIFWNYSNPSFNLAGLVVERASGVPFRQYMQDYIFTPAGMSATTLEPQEVMERDDFTYGHQGGRPEFIYAPDGYDCGAYSPSGLVFSTVEDLARWAILMMGDGGQVLAAESWASMQAMQIYLDYYPGYGYGYGVFIEPYQDLVVRQHGGNVPGWGTYLLWIPERGFAVAIIGNTFDSLFQSAYYALELILEPNPVDPQDFSTDPIRWRRYEGAYELLDLYGGMDRVEVELQEHILQMHFLGPPYLAELNQVFLDTFGMDLDGNGSYDWTEVITFIDTAQHNVRGPAKRQIDMSTASPTLWFRNRAYVGQMIVE